ncbi:putative plant non-specific lipid-transfer protein/Par allergen [Dioscorea sansibarensis]
MINMRIQTVLIMLLLIIFLQNFIIDSEGAIQCSDVLKEISPCTSYLKSGSGSPSSACCSGISKLNSAASTSADKKAACKCLLSAAQKIKPDAAAAKGLPSSCGISLPYTISVNIDCSKYVPLLFLIVCFLIGLILNTNQIYIYIYIYILI